MAGREYGELSRSVGLFVNHAQIAIQEGTCGGGVIYGLVQKITVFLAIAISLHPGGLDESVDFRTKSIHRIWFR